MIKTIVITGPSGSGKTFLANKLSRDLDNSIVIKTDSYYRDDLFIKILSLFINDIYDRLISIKNYKLLKTINSIYNKENNIIVYKYDFEHKKSYTSIIKNINHIKFLIIEGIFAHRINLNNINSINILCRENKEICFQRRIIRDKLERGRNQKEVTSKFRKSWYLFFKHLSRYKRRNLIHEFNPLDQTSYTNLINKIIKYN